MGSYPLREHIPGSVFMFIYRSSLTSNHIRHFSIYVCRTC